MTHSPADPVRERLDRIVQAYGRNALADAVALRAAWLATAGTVVDEPPPEILAMAAESGRASPGWGVDDLVPAAMAASGLPEERLRPAGVVLADAMAGRPDPHRPAGVATSAGDGTGTGAAAGIDGPTGPPRRSGPAGPRLVWDDDDPPSPGAAEEPADPGPSDATTTRVPTGGRRPGRWTVLLVGAAVLAVAAGALVVPRLAGAEGGPVPGEDRYSVTDVAERYRALGPDLLAGATRCAPLPMSAGETERVGCDVEGRAMVLRTFTAAEPMRAARGDAVPRADVVRSTRRTRDDGEIALSEQRSGLSTVAWDAQLPRPVSAVVTARESLVDLTAFLERRRFTLLPRPEVTGPMFRSGRLWSLADGYTVTDLAPGCAAVQPRETEQEAVECDLPGGGRSKYVLLRDRTAFLNARRDFADDGGTRPGTRSVTAWNRNGGPTVGLLAQFVNLEGRPGLYYDDDSLGGYGVLFGPPGGSQAALFESWSFIAQPR